MIFVYIYIYAVVHILLYSIFVLFSLIDYRNLFFLCYSCAGPILGKGLDRQHISSSINIIVMNLCN